MSPTWAPCSVLKKYEFFRCRMAFFKILSQMLCRVPDYAVSGSPGALSPTGGTRRRSLLALHSPVASLIWSHARERETTCPSKVPDRGLRPRMISPFT
jgi:hypothetical protein